MEEQERSGKRTINRRSPQDSRRPRPIILVVEDNEDDFFLLQRAFTKIGQDAEMTHLQDGSEALKYFAGAKENPRLIPALLLLDLKLPGVSGFEILEWLKKDPVLMPVIVNVLSSSAEPSDIQEAFRLGANAYTVKPIGLDEYEEVVSGILKFWFELGELSGVHDAST